MPINKTTRLSKAAREFNVGISTIVEFLRTKGVEIDANPNTKLDDKAYSLLVNEYSSDVQLKQRAQEIALKPNKAEAVSIDDVNTTGETVLPEEKEEEISHKKEAKGLKIVGEIDLNPPKKEKTPEKELKEEKEPEKVEKTEEKSEKEVAEPIKKGDEPKVVGKINLDELNQKTRPTKKTRAEKEAIKKAEDKVTKTIKDTQKTKEEPKKTEEAPKKEENKSSEDFLETKVKKLDGLTVVGKIELKDQPTRPAKKKRKRIQKSKVDVKDVAKNQKPGNRTNNNNANRSRANAANKRKGRKPIVKQEVNEEDVQKQIRETLAKLTKGKSKGAKHRREKRDLASQKQEEEAKQMEQQKQTIQLTEFVTVSEVATMMDVPVNEVISACMSLGLMVNLNQRLDAETISLVASEFNYNVEFVSAEIQEAINEEEEDSPEDLIPRPPIVTVMGHVDHGKTSLLDYIRNTNVIAGEAGGITQHIGAYNVTLESGKHITFLDTPGHEAFTAMRARGAQVTDIAVIIIATDDNVMPQTKEAISHASAAGVPIVFALNKIDTQGADPERIKSELANMNYLVEDWGGKYQSQEISAKKGTGVDELLEKILLEAELLELKANPDKRASGTVIESSLDKGRGYVTTVLVESGTLHVGDIMLAGSYTGNVKAMFNERGTTIESVRPAEPVTMLGLNGAPTAGDKFNIMTSDKEARNIAHKREQLQREQSLRTQKHITLDEIGRRIAVGNFQELNIIVKGDVDGSIEALSDSLMKLSTEEIQLNVIHKAVGQISESDVMLATASEAIIIGFQVRPSLGARALAEKEEIDIRLYSIIYDAIEEVKQAMEGMLSPEIKEEVTATLEIMETFKVSKVGTIAGCIVRSGKIHRNSKVRVIRDGIVVYTGELGSLKRFKDDVKEVAKGFECGLNIANFNDIKVGDIIEAYENKEFSRTL
ncbi:translation initiation factor 2 (bIF-2) [Balneicella halophila]|uniref:Translation initiation factor IF-2 n=1 Tax=Balneicella halophila TaxID=1537566 RepID=A0A7L4UQT9_BALHA|nr:translation initiation factor IF-2 [Balneicella halophila]PVX52120.1 translation initiation factor 2 (bIF-2) [Balneicella halophila]